MNKLIEELKTQANQKKKRSKKMKQNELDADKASANI